MKFDYRVIIVGGVMKLNTSTAQEFEDKCNKLGEQGFELISFRDVQTSGKFIAVFKRPIE